VQEVLDRHMNDPIMTTGSVEDGIQYVVNLTKERLPKPKPEPSPFEDGYKYPVNQATPKKDDGLLDSIRKRKQERRGR
jgi:hypothetical protein